MSKNITYLLGAGASAKALPTIRSMSLRMKYFFELSKLVLERMPRQELYDKYRIKTYEKLLNEIEELGTPDIVAKTLVFKGKSSEQELYLLKQLLSCYMIFEQIDETGMHHGRFTKEEAEKIWSNRTAGMKESNLTHPKVTIDNRYVELLSTCLAQDESGKLKFPANLKFLTWNYDHQIERALGYVSPKPLIQLQREFGIFPLTDNDDNHNSGIGNLSEERLIPEALKASVFKLNGTAGYIPKRNQSLFDVNTQKLDDNAWVRIVNIMFNEIEASVTENKLSFAWDEEIPRIYACRKACVPAIMGSNVIVVIGYSFPNFNRKIDRFLFSHFKGDKIYVQDPYADEIIERLDGVKPGLRKMAVAIKSSGSFTIPDEFWE